MSRTYPISNSKRDGVINLIISLTLLPYRPIINRSRFIRRLRSLFDIEVL